MNESTSAPEALPDMEPSKSPEPRSTTPVPPALPPRPDKRALLLVYIHGFKGTETSFKDFPTDLQECLRTRLQKHTVHTHIYPKYKTKRHFSIATVNFCEWLRNTLRSYYRPVNTLDVILIGHSMGGSLACEAAILLSRVTFQHNIIGIVGLDVPFLGVHTHVVTSGVAGLVPTKKAAEGKPLPLDRPTAGGDASTSTLSLPESPYASTNSSHTSLSETLVPPRTPSPQPSEKEKKAEKKSDWTKTLTKTVTAIYNNRHDLTGAGPRYLWSHLEYGHILLDPAELKAQYDALRQIPINFVNYYTCIPRKEEGKEGRVFCALPSGVARDMDGWEAVEMPMEMDEPTAHSAIFVKEEFPGYYGMVERIAGKIASWEK